ncbi:anthranilate synthase component I [Oscillospiraceae bacterium LCP25S3_E10]|nr:anthranilate synthase component I [Ruminococcus sp.]MDD6447353.1 anthranilate synthase component I [Ruminococcus sp.]MDY2857169.1 anthranilate synthase component I [Oscillospiraceae bacterium]
MIKPSLEEINSLAQSYKIIPVTKEIYADTTTPITLLRKISAISNRFYLLESVEGGKKWGRYSFVGFDPKSRIYYKSGKVVIEGEGAKEIATDKPFDAVREFLKNYTSPKFEDIPPFTGGLVGYFGYSMIAVAEPVLKLRESQFNDFDLMFFDKVVVYDHLTQKMIVIVNMKTDDVDFQYKKACDDIEKIVSIITDNQPLPPTNPYRNVEFKSNMTEDEFCKMVEKTKEYIYEGDIFQCVVSRRFESEYKGDLIDAYRVLRITNPSPYMVYMKFDDSEIISTSPETLVRLKNGRLSTYPVAGSRPRGATKEEDEQLEKDLLSDQKELAEHNMLVDLGRNDIGRIAKINSVEVTAYKVINKYSKIMHIASEVEGDIRDDMDAFNAIESVLPAGTLSGAPKIRACEIIEELEQYPRGIYGGALGYVDFNGNLDVAIAIRMAVKKNDKVYVQAGAGIVADSVPHSEYMETYNKALAVMNAVQGAAEADLP